MSLRRLCEITLEPRAFFRDKHLSSGLTTAVIFNVGLNVSIFSADINVKNQDKANFFVSIAITTNFLLPEMIEPFTRSLANKNQKFLFSWVPAHLFGTEEFSIFIEYSEFGEFLVNGLVGEIIREANVEDAVAFLSDKIATQVS